MSPLPPPSIPRTRWWWPGTQRLAVGQPAMLDGEEPLPGELEVVPLHVDRPALVTHDVDAMVDVSDQLLGGGTVVTGRLERHVGHALDGHMEGRIGGGAAVRGTQAADGGDGAVQLVAGQYAVLDQVERLAGHPFMVDGHRGQAVGGGPIPGDMHHLGP